MPELFQAEGRLEALALPYDTTLRQRSIDIKSIERQFRIRENETLII